MNTIVSSVMFVLFSCWLMLHTLCVTIQRTCKSHICGLFVVARCRQVRKCRFLFDINHCIFNRGGIGDELLYRWALGSLTEYGSLMVRRLFQKRLPKRHYYNALNGRGVDTCQSLSGSSLLSMARFFLSLSLRLSNFSIVPSPFQPNNKTK